MSGLVRLYDLSRDALVDWVVDRDQPRYRADQLWHWMYVRLADDFAAMTSLPTALRTTLAAEARLHTTELVTSTVSADGMADKSLYRLADGQLIETVLMHYTDPVDDAGDDPPRPKGSVEPIPPGRHTLCLSTQAGCAMGCVFCATGQMGLVRDLSAGECMEQVVHLARRLAKAGERLSNVVFMGMGEPLANWSATLQTIDCLTDPDGIGMSPRRITVSTVGLIPAIDRLASAGNPVRLAVSLHAPDDALRRELVPIAAAHPLRALLDSCRSYQERTGRRVTFEYVLIRDVNDSADHAARLAALLRPLQGHVNLIPLNPTAGSPLKPSRGRDVVRFRNALAASGVAASLRMRRGIDIDAGCGQLRSRAVAGSVRRTLSAPPTDRTEEPR